VIGLTLVIDLQLLLLNVEYLITYFVFHYQV